MRFVGIVLLIGLVAAVRLSNRSRSVLVMWKRMFRQVSQCVEITGAFQGRPYQLRMAYSKTEGEL